MLEAENFFHSLMIVSFRWGEGDSQFDTGEEFVWDGPIKGVGSVLVHLDLVLGPISQKWDHFNSLCLLIFIP